MLSLYNKYAEGYPGRRYYGGCEHADSVERLAIERVKNLFGSQYANVQPHSGAQANAAVMHALVRPGDTVMGLNLAHGGHLTHGMKLNFSGRLYDIIPYSVDEDTYEVDMDEVARLAREHQPKMIVAGWSAYPRQLDFAAFRQIADEVGAYLMVDMAHFAGLVAAGLHPSPVPHAHVVTFCPNCAARIAATYPPGPAPTTSVSTSTGKSPTTMNHASIIINSGSCKTRLI